MTDLSKLIERLKDRAEEDEQCAANNAAVAEAMSEQMKRFAARDGSHNTYAVRLAVDHSSSQRRDQRYAEDLRAAIGLLTALQSKDETNVEGV